MTWKFMAAARQIDAITGSCMTQNVFYFGFLPVTVMFAPSKFQNYGTLCIHTQRHTHTHSECVRERERNGKSCELSFCFTYGNGFFGADPIFLFLPNSCTLHILILCSNWKLNHIPFHFGTDVFTHNHKIQREKNDNLLQLNHSNSLHSFCHLYVCLCSIFHAHFYDGWWWQWWWCCCCHCWCCLLFYCSFNIVLLWRSHINISCCE